MDTPQKTRRVNAITGQVEVSVADVISYLERSEGRKFSISEVGARFREFEALAEQASAGFGMRQEEYGPWLD